ncbi:hypothetical protein TNCV_1823101 [Trichonephila clavipes]|nr:hypothetical protein TNCV_1823101 [Trichonephila clavipes]
MSSHSLPLLKLQSLFQDSESYRRFLRMDVSTFEELEALVFSSIERKNTSMRKAIPAAERIALTLRYITTGITGRSVGDYNATFLSSSLRYSPKRSCFRLEMYFNVDGCVPSNEECL